MSVLLVAEHDNSKLKPFTLNAITAASKIDTDVHVLVAGANCENVSKETANIPLVKKVSTWFQPELTKDLIMIGFINGCQKMGLFNTKI